MADPSRDLLTQRKVRGDAAAEEHRFDRVLRGRARGLLGEHLGDRLLERRGHVRHGYVALLLQLAHEAQDGCLQSAEREVEPIGERCARERERVRIAFFRDALDDRAARKAQVQESGDLVERFAGGVVDRPSEWPKATVRLHQHEIAVRAADDQDDGREIRLRRNVVDFIEPVRVHVALEMVHADEGQPSRERQPTPVVRANEEAPNEAGADRRGDRIDLGDLASRVSKRVHGQRVQRPQVFTRCDLGDDAARVLVDELRGDDVGADPPAVLDDRDAGLVAGRLDREDPQSPSSSWALSFWTRSRTARSRSRSVHMIRASSLLSE